MTENVANPSNIEQEKNKNKWVGMPLGGVSVYMLDPHFFKLTF